MERKIGKQISHQMAQEDQELLIETTDTLFVGLGFPDLKLKDFDAQVSKADASIKRLIKLSYYAGYQDALSRVNSWPSFEVRSSFIGRLRGSLERRFKVHCESQRLGPMTEQLGGNPVRY